MSHATLELISRSDREDSLHGRLDGAEAYDGWHLIHYAKEILRYHELLKEQNCSIVDVPRKEKNLLNYLAIAALPECGRVVELGSALFEMIDGLSLVDRIVRRDHGLKDPPTIGNLAFEGIEPSEILARVSALLHHQYNVVLHPSHRELPGGGGLLSDRAVSSYAFESADAAASFMNGFDAGVLNLLLSKGDTFQSSVLGKTVTYFSMAELVSHLDKPLYHLFGLKAPEHMAYRSAGRPVIEGFFLFCAPEVAAQFIALSKQYKPFETYFRSEGIELKAAISLL